MKKEAVKGPIVFCCKKLHFCEQEKFTKVKQRQKFCWCWIVYTRPRASENLIRKQTQRKVIKILSPMGSEKGLTNCSTRKCDFESSRHNVVRLNKE